MARGAAVRDPGGPGRGAEGLCQAGRGLLSPFSPALLLTRQTELRWQEGAADGGTSPAEAAQLADSSQQAQLCLKQDPTGNWKSKRQSHVGERLAPSPRCHGPRGSRRAPSALLVGQVEERALRPHPSCPRGCAERQRQSWPQLRAPAAGSVPSQPQAPLARGTNRTKVRAGQRGCHLRSRGPDSLNPAAASSRGRAVPFPAALLALQPHSREPTAPARQGPMRWTLLVQHKAPQNPSTASVPRVSAWAARTSAREAPGLRKLTALSLPAVGLGSPGALLPGQSLLSLFAS